MNKAILIGRLTKDPVKNYTQGENKLAYTRFTLAVDRKYKKAGESQEADFISCITFGKQAEFVEKYFRQGMKMVAVGRIQTSSYTHEGKRLFTTNIVIDEIEFGEKKQNDNVPDPVPEGTDEFVNIPEGLDEELPFN